MRAALLLLVGCGRLAFDEHVPIDVDLGSPTIPAMLAAPDAIEAHPHASRDARELYFSSDRGGSFDIWRSTRALATDPWGPPAPVDELNSDGDESSASLSTDGLTLWLASDREGTLGDHDIWMSTRPSLSSPWSPPLHVPELSSDADDDAPYEHPDGSELIFHSKRAGGRGRRDLWRAQRLADGFAAPQLIAELATEDEDADPFITDGGDLIFDSNRESGSYRELFAATRVGDRFAAPVRLEIDQLDSAKADADPWLSPDGSYLIFLSSRTGNDEIYEVYLDAPLVP